MEHLYNPDLMSEAEIKQTFVARQGLVDELVSLIERQPEGAGVQHVVLIAPRGMGKTTMLLMVQFALQERGLSSRWQAVRFPEESYGIYDLADFWLEALNLLSQETNDPALKQQAEALKSDFPASGDLQEAAFALLKDWCRQQKRRLVLLVDNFDMILEQVNSEQDNARLRNALMNDGTVMLIGGATTFFQEARAYDQPLYNFFKIYHLDRLSFEQTLELLRQRAATDSVPDFEQKLQANRTRLRVLEYFTGGNPRLTLMLYRILMQSEVGEVRLGLEKLLDEVTPYYKAKIESLPAQQRKILDHIARISSQTNEGLTPTEIAGAIRLTPSGVSSQLKRLSELGYVRAANLRGRHSYYTLSEPLYAIWHQMRFGRDTRRRMQWLVDFLKGWYDAEKLGSESKRLERRFQDLLKDGLVREARETLEHRRYLADAMRDDTARYNAIDSIIRSYLELSDTTTIKEDLLQEIDLKNLSIETLEALYDAQCISKAELEKYRNLSVPLSPEILRASAYWLTGLMALHQGRTEDALRNFDYYLELQQDNSMVWHSRGKALGDLNRYEEALNSFDHAIELFRDNPDTWVLRGQVLVHLAKYKEALDSLNQAIKKLIEQNAASLPLVPLYLNRFVLYMSENLYQPESAKLEWKNAVEAGKGYDNWYAIANETLFATAEADNLQFVRELITETQMEQVFFPLARAIDFLQTGDNTLMEKLSPELRNIVEYIVEKLRSGVAKAE